MTASRRSWLTLAGVLLILHGTVVAEEGRRDRAALTKGLKELWTALRDYTPATGEQGRLARVWIAMAMHELGAPGSRERFRELLNDRDPALRREAAAALGKVRNLDVTDLCVHALGENDDATTCAELATRLAEMGDLRAVPALIGAARHDNARLHAAIDRALRRLGSPEICIIRTDGSSPIKLTANAASDTCPAWSSDGKKIAFASDREEGWEIYVMNADGSGVRRLTNSNGVNAEPAWSPDGKNLAFRSSRDGNSEIYVMAADGGDPHNLTRHPGEDSHPTWSPDGTQIAFSSKRDRECDIYVMNADGTALANVTKRAGCDHQPAWSPDGLQIAFSSWRHGGWAAYVMSPDGSDQTRLAWIPQDSRPTWSPDSTAVAFASIGAPCRPPRNIAQGFGSRREGEPWPSVHVLRTDRSGTRKLTVPNALCLDAAWAPDGNRLAACVHRYVDAANLTDIAKAAASENPHVRHRAVMTLARSMAPSVSELLHSALEDGHSLVRLEAARGLSWLADESGMTALRKVVLGPETDRRVRYFAWQALRPLTVELGPLAALETMQATTLSRALMEFREPRGAYFSLFDLYAGLLATGEAGIPRLSRCAMSENALTRFIAVRVLGDLGDEVARLVFENAAKDANALVSAEAKRALAKLRPTRRPEGRDILLFTDFASPDLGEWEVRDTWQLPTKGGVASPPFMQPSNWHACPVSKRLTQDSNILGEGGGTHIVTGSPDWTDYEITCRAVSYDNDSFGILFRYADEKNDLRLVTSSQGKRVALVQWLRGEEHILARLDRGYETWREYDVKVVAKGTKIEGRIGDLRVEAECAEPPRGRIGFMTGANALTYFDDLLVRDLRSKKPEPGKATLDMEPQGAQGKLPDGAEVYVGLGHRQYVNSVAFTPDGQRLVTGSSDHMVKLWDVETGREIRTLATGTIGRLHGLALSPDGRRFAFGAEDRTVKLCETETGRQIRTFAGHERGLTSVAFSPDGRLVASGGWDNAVKLWDTATGREAQTLTGHSKSVRSVAFSPNGALVASGSYDSTVRLWDPTTGREVRSLVGHERSLRSVAFSPDGHLLASASIDRTVKVWEVETGRAVQSFATGESSPCSVAFSPDGSLLASGMDFTTVKLWDLSTGQEVRTLAATRAAVTLAEPHVSLAFSPDGRLLASSGGGWTVALWDVDSGQQVRTLGAQPTSVRCMALSADGRWLACGDERGLVRLWDPSTARPIGKLVGHKGRLSCVASGPAGRLLATGGWDGVVKLWEVATQRELRTLKGHTAYVMSVALSPDGRFVASGSSDRSVKLWDVATGQTVRSLTGLKGTAWTVAFSPDGSLLAGAVTETKRVGRRSRITASEVKLWDRATGAVIRALKGRAGVPHSVVFSPDGRLIALGNFDGTVLVWDVENGYSVRTLEGHTRGVRCVTFGPQDRILASGSFDGPVRIWDVATGRTLRTLIGHESAVRGLQFTPDGRLLVSASSGGTIRIRRPDSGKLLVTLAEVGSKGDHLAWTPDGYLLATPAAEKFVSLRTGSRVSALGPYRDILCRPDVIAGRLTKERRKLQMPER